MNLGMFRKQAAAKFLRTDAPGAIVNVAPPSTVAIFSTMALLLLAVALLATLGRAQVVAEGRGVVRPDKPAVVLHAPFAGTVVAVNLGLRDTGHLGDVLLTLSTGTDTAAHDKCARDLVTEQGDMVALERRLADWNSGTSHDRDASTALVLISQIRSQRDKVSTLKQRCEAQGSILDRSRITFPVDAMVADLAVGPGAQVHEGDVLATLVPSTARLVGYVALPETYRSELAVDQPVLVKFDALPFDEVGAGSARVTRLLEVLPSGVKLDARDGDSVFAEIAIDAMPAGAGPARSGMAFTADVKTRRPRVLSLLFGTSRRDD